METVKNAVASVNEGVANAAQSAAEALQGVAGRVSSAFIRFPDWCNQLGLPPLEHTPATPP